MTTLELITAMAISSILGAMTLFVFLGLNSGAASSIERSVTATEARVILSSWNNMLQVAETPVRVNTQVHAFEKVTDHELIFYSAINTRTGTNIESLPTKIRLLSAGGKVIEERYTPTAAGWSTTPTVRRTLATSASVNFVAVASSGARVGSTGAGYDQLCRVIGGSTYAGICSSVGCSPDPETALVAVPSCTGVRGANAALGLIANVRITLVVTDKTGTSHTYEGATIGAAS